MEIKSNIGKLIDRSPFNREYIQKHFGKSRNTISNWCTGKSYPSVPQLFELAKLLGCWVDDLYEEIKEQADPLDEDIYELELSQRVYNAIKRNRINTIRELINLDLQWIKLGPKALEEIENKLNKYKEKIKGEQN
jgi:transcriptional regulator with XRE-family HTH domain